MTLPSTKDSAKLLNMPRYTAFLEPAPEGGFTISIPMLPGCISEGDTFEEAIKNIRDAMDGYLAVLKEDGDPIPTEHGEPILTQVTAPDSTA